MKSSSTYKWHLKPGLISWLFIVLAMGSVVGCSIFDTRTAEPPGGESTGTFLQPDRPEIVLDNLINAIQNLNTQNYLRNLDTENFEYTPSNAALAANPEVWTGWSSDEEQIYFNNLRASAENTTGHQLRLENITNDLQSSNRRQIVADYMLTLLHNRSNIGVPTNISGRFVLELETGEDGLWKIVAWTDVSAGDSFSWSDLRASFLVD